MEIRFYIDPETGEPHIHEHGIMEHDVRQVLRGPGEEMRGTENSRIKIGQARGGRYLKVVYVPDEDGRGIFVVTAYELQGKQELRFVAVDGKNHNEKKTTISPRVERGESAQDNCAL